MLKPRDTKRACTGCPREFECRLDNALCDICERRIQAVRNEVITANYPTQQDLDNLREELQALYDIHENIVLEPSDKPCPVCGGQVSKTSRSTLCLQCYNKYGGTCKMEGCNTPLAKSNKSGYCKTCYNIIRNRTKAGKNPYAPVNRRRKAIK